MALLNENQQSRINNIYWTVSSVSLLGSVGGLMYANKTGGHFWRYVGYFILGGMVAGLPAKLVALPFTNKIIKESESNSTQE
jgi:hypothetical protein